MVSVQSSKFLRLALVFLALGLSVRPAISADSKLPGDSDQKFEADEREGKFHDDELPVEVSLASSSFPKPDETCSKGSKDFESAWKEGFNQGMAGQRFITPVSYNDNNPQSVSKFSTDKPERKACNRFSSGPDSDEKKLNCCNLGYQAALPLLATEIAELSKRKSEKPPRLSRCKEEHFQGQTAAKDICNISCPPPPQSPVRYLGCYTLGFWQQLKSCQDPHLKEQAAKVFGTQVPGSAIASADEKEPPAASDGLPVVPPIGASSAK